MQRDKAGTMRFDATRQGRHHAFLDLVAVMTPLSIHVLTYQGVAK